MVQSGKLSITDLKLNFVVSNDAPSLRVAGTVDLKRCGRVRSEQGAVLRGARAVHVAAATLEKLLKSLYHFDDIRIDAPSANLARQEQKKVC